LFPNSPRKLHQAEAVTVKAGDATLEPGDAIGERFKHGDHVSFEVPKWPWRPWRVTFFGATSRDFTMEIWD